MKRITKIEENKPSGAKLRVAAYCRVSTDQDAQLLSLQSQKAHYEALIKSNPAWEYAGLYYDEGISGTKKDTRPALMKMIADCEHGLIDQVITKSISRFARNTTDTLEMVRKLLELNIPILFEKEEINTGKMESELMLSIMSSLAESESVSISENNTWGIELRFKNGTFKVCCPPYGYDWDKEKAEMVVNPEQAEIVCFIFDQTLAGVGTMDIAKELNRRDVPTKRGGKWTGSTVNGIIRNEKYTGDCLFQKTYTDTSFNRHRNLGQKNQYYMEDHHEAIVSHETFEAANAVVERRRAEKGIETDCRKYQNRYPLSGKVICGECGGVFKRKVCQKKVILSCTNHIDDKTSCSMKSVDQEAVERAFASLMNKLISTRSKILRPFCEALGAMSQTDALLQIHQYEEDLEGIADKRQTLKGLFAQGILEPAVFTQEMNRLSAEQDRITTAKNALSYNASSEMSHYEEAKKLLRFAEHAQMLDGFDADRFGEFVERIVVKTRSELVFEMKCGLNLTEVI